MSALTAQQALDAAQSAHSTAQRSSDEASATAQRLRAEVAAGDSKITPEQLATADHEADHAALVAQGAAAAIPALTTQVRTAQADEIVDEIVVKLPVLGTGVMSALDDVAAALDTFITAARTYDDFTAGTFARLGSSAQGVSPRVSLTRFGTPSVDGLPLTPSHGSAHLAAILTPAMRALGAESTVVQDLKLAASKAAAIPTV